MNDILKKIDGVLEECKSKVEDLSKKQAEAESAKNEYIRMRDSLSAKEKQLDARASIIEKYEDIDKAIINNAETANTLSDLEKELNIAKKDLERREAILSKEKEELAKMATVLKTKDQNLEKAKLALEEERANMQDKLFEEIKKKLMK